MRILIVAAVILASGCASVSRIAPWEAVKEYEIGAEDVVEVAVYGSEGLSRTVPVRPDGMISLPILGDVSVSGRTTRDVAEEILERLKPYLHDPRVVVIVREVNAPRIFVLGEVNRPGTYPLRAEMNVVEALAVAGGLAEFANENGVVLIRRSKAGSTREILDCEELIEDEESYIPRLLPGDTLFVP